MKWKHLNKGAFSYGLFLERNDKSKGEDLTFFRTYSKRTTSERTLICNSINFHVGRFLNGDKID